MLLSWLTDRSAMSGAANAPVAKSALEAAAKVIAILYMIFVLRGMCQRLNGRKAASFHRAASNLDNRCGIPAISLPMATHEHGLPLGIQAQAKQAYDGLLLQLAAQIERAIDGKWNAGARPGVHVSS